jgi:predicted Zn-ribbon and HTH transcriptional regulator
MNDFIAAFFADIPFRLGWKRARHIRNGHPYKKSELVEKIYSEKHPASNKGYVFAINVMKCNDCGLIWFDIGLELRRTRQEVKKWVKEQKEAA